MIPFKIDDISEVIKMKVYKGNILTVNANDDVAKYLVEDKGRIAYVGNELPEK